MAFTASQGVRAARAQAWSSGWASPAATRQTRRRGLQPCVAAASNSGDAAGGGSTPPSRSSDSITSSFQRSPWELMGRVVREDRVALQFDTQLNLGLVRSAAARESGLDVEEFEARLQRLFTLVPFLQERMLRMQPKLLAALAAQPEDLALRLVELKTLLPQADAASIVAHRPSLLLDAEWERVPAGVAALRAKYSEEEAARLASAEPLLLVEDLEHVLQELGRLLPGQPPLQLLQQRPSLASKVSRLQHLSLWLVGAGNDAAAMLLRDPALVYSVQRGSRSLGPGAEF